jgi:hypothetical protein
MNRTWIGIGGVLLVLIIVFAFFVLRTSEGTMPAKATAPETIQIERIKDVYKKGVHTISGVALVPTACTKIDTVATTTAAGIVVNIASVSDTGMCLELPSEIPFSVTATAPQTATTNVYLNSKLATSTSL